MPLPEVCNSDGELLRGVRFFGEVTDVESPDDQDACPVAVTRVRPTKPSDQFVCFKGKSKPKPIHLPSLLPLFVYTRPFL